jgi:hypothetical protein
MLRNKGLFQPLFFFVSETLPTSVAVARVTAGLLLKRLRQ